MATQLLGALAQSHYFDVKFLTQLFGGVLLVASRYVPVGLILLGRLLVTIPLYHGLIAPAGIAPGLVAAALWAAVFYALRSVFQPIWVNSVQAPK